MRKYFRTLLTTTTVLATLAGGSILYAYAESPSSRSSGGMMQGSDGMMQGSGGMMHGPVAEMMRGMPMSAGDRVLGHERPVLSLALRRRAQLGLSEDQATTLQAFVDRFGKEAEERLRQTETAERELAGLLKEEPADLAQVDGKVRAIEKLRADLRLRRIQTIAEGRSVLTSEQRTKLDLLAAERGGAAQGHGTRGAEEMHRFMNSERMPQAMSAMMAMAERMGGGDTMLGMVRMMEMMSGMGGMMGGAMRAPEQPRDQKQ